MGTSSFNQWYPLSHSNFESSRSWLEFFLYVYGFGYKYPPIQPWKDLQCLPRKRTFKIYLPATSWSTAILFRLHQLKNLDLLNIQPPCYIVPRCISLLGSLHTSNKSQSVMCQSSGLGNMKGDKWEYGTTTLVFNFEQPSKPPTIHDNSKQKQYQQSILLGLVLFYPWWKRYVMSTSERKGWSERILTDKEHKGNSSRKSSS